MAEPAKKLHWTQRPGGKERLSAAVKASYRKKKRELNLVKESPNAQPPRSEAIPSDVRAYALGYIECWVQAYAASAGVSGETLTAELGEILRGKGRRK